MIKAQAALRKARALTREALTVDGQPTYVSHHGGKVFAALHALYAGRVSLVAMGLVFVPVLHQLLHRFHWAKDRSNTS